MDATLLRSGLTEYASALARQLDEMREQRERLSSCWLHTRSVYQGQGAEIFADRFDRSMTTLKNYITGLEHMLPILRDRLEALEKFDSGSAPEI